MNGQEWIAMMAAHMDEMKCTAKIRLLLLLVYICMECKDGGENFGNVICDEYFSI